MFSALLNDMHDTSLLLGLFIGACVGFVIAILLIAVHNIGRDDYAEKSDRYED